MSHIAQVLHEDIMKDVEAVLAQKADNLWRRGQAELTKLQLDRKQVVTSLKELQDRQEQLVAEHSAMRSALVDITTKLEFVATEMREAIRSMPQRAPGWNPESSGADGVQHALPLAPMPPPMAGGAVSCSASSLAKSPSCAGLQSPAGHHAASARGLPAACAAAAAACVAAQAAVASTTSSPGADLTGAVSSALAAASSPLEQLEQLPEGPCTPRRSSNRGTPPSHSGQHPPGSPAVLLSLASALPSSATPPPAGPPPCPPSKRVHIADCLDLAAPRPEVHSAPVGLALSSIHPAASYMSDYSPESEASGGLAGGIEDQLGMTQDKACWHVLQSDIPEFWAVRGSGAGSGGPTLLGGAVQQPSSGPAVAKAQAQLRAEAPAFIPGAADSAVEEAFNPMRYV